ncbi:hypothetical protein [Cryptosporidium parvum Iowa II]|uniref:Peptidase S26 domain-containing protein n=1 Tax=Cryptosporidium parvum (strain Iowa II) TaxID=353152 RepID=A3FQN4_CRYPI|nr:hypothetical protein [Cryptosporidium parvum Iowa II]EAZ51240.1 hypothetical protein cgd4_620 [Cryptosporidium parvum Iowa II]
MPNKFIFRTSLKYAKILLGIHLIQKYGFSICITDGPSMIPTIGPKRELLLYEKLSISLSRIFKLNGNFPVNRNDIIIANSVENPEILVCKRVIGKNCNFIDFIHKRHSCFQMKIPPNYFWIQGDNFNNSRDSRNYGPIHESLIIGRVIYKVSNFYYYYYYYITN